ncbi:lytic murein transglycosylase [Lutibaculum baratangense]|uniref:Membrane-bound lytic murein transglycosylase B n=1 Tax=Lutibaculum baratangense AMV1 TaxID=631454 RepID=V4TD80_9HYPH|nr:lytic murein transglycosylase [Lutibaculum baratangense]ESR24248.1 Membrane-bound lytic murein transglycosylase B precursor [Lutibaculum baratangense AMV1]
MTWLGQWKYLGGKSALRSIVVGAGLVLFSFGSAMAAQSFEAWRDGFQAQARQAGVSAETFRRAFEGVTPDPAVLEAANRQAEFVKPIWEYLESAVSNSRIETGRQMLQRYDREMAEIERRYGVSRYVFTAIWGMESSYGAVLDNHKVVRPVIRSLATLAHGDPKRAEFARTQLIAALKILQNGDVHPSRMMGSWAGAMGHTQFIPTTYEAYAVDFTGDGRRDIWDSVPDALASTANYLKNSGWADGETWGYEVNLPRGFDFGLADEQTKRSVTEWEYLGVRRTHARDFPRPNDQAVLMLPAGANGPAFLMLRNFNAIKRYNNATSYALGVGHLADRLAGGGTFAQSWPTQDQPLTRTQKEEMQRLLSSRGFDPGGVDGQVGPMTRSAIRSFQGRSGLPADGYPSYSLLERLRTGS